MDTPAMDEAMQPPFFGSEFDAQELLRLRQKGASEQEMARVGLN